MDLVNAQPGKDLGLKIEFVNSEVVLTVALNTSGVDASVKVELKADYFLDLIAKAIPGQIDDTVIALLKQGLSLAK
jgi:hypothetical protein